MPTLIVPPRITPDTDAMLAAALAAGWGAERLTNWRMPAGLSQREPVLYGAAITARRRRLALIEELPAREAYSIWVEQLLSTIEARHGTD